MPNCDQLELLSTNFQTRNDEQKGRHVNDQGKTGLKETIDLVIIHTLTITLNRN